MPQFKNLKIGAKLSLLIGIFLAGFIVFGYFALSGLHQVEINGPLYVSIALGKDLVADILPPPEYIIETYLTTYQMVASVENGKQADELPALIAKVDQFRQDYQDRNAYWKKTLPDGDLKHELVVTSSQSAEKFYQILYDQYIPALKAGDVASAKKILNDSLTPVYTQHRQSIDRVASIADQQNSQYETSAANDTNRMDLVLVVIGLIAAGGSVLVGLIISRGIVKPVTVMVGVARQIAAGDVSQKIELHSTD